MINNHLIHIVFPPWRYDARLEQLKGCLLMLETVSKNTLSEKSSAKVSKIFENTKNRIIMFVNQPHFPP